MTMAANLQLIAEAVEAGEPLTAEQRVMVAAALRNQGLTLPAGRNAERDRLLVECRQRFFAGRTDHDACHEISSQWRRYAASGWLRERSSESPRIAGTLRGMFWEIMQQSPRTLSAERIRKIVGHLK
ncbi:hypothetical protein ACVWXQ_001833 [Bradyrhizobium sp. S3.14.4]